MLCGIHAVCCLSEHWVFCLAVLSPECTSYPQPTLRTLGHLTFPGLWTYERKISGPVCGTCVFCFSMTLSLPLACFLSFPPFWTRRQPSAVSLPHWVLRLLKDTVPFVLILLFLLFRRWLPPLPTRGISPWATRDPWLWRSFPLELVMVQEDLASWPLSI